MDRVKRKQVVLVVDDEAALRRLQRKNLERADFEVLEACDGDEALRVLEDEVVDIVLIDLVMPNKEGLETLSEIGKRWPKLPVVTMSGGGRGGAGLYLNLSRTIGARGALAKPFSRDELICEINRCLTPIDESD